MKLLPIKLTYMTDTFLHVSKLRARQAVPLHMFALW